MENNESLEKNLKKLEKDTQKISEELKNKAINAEENEDFDDGPMSHEEMKKQFETYSFLMDEEKEKLLREYYGEASKPEPKKEQPDPRKSEQTHGQDSSFNEIKPHQTGPALIQEEAPKQERDIYEAAAALAQEKSKGMSAKSAVANETKGKADTLAERGEDENKLAWASAFAPTGNKDIDEDLKRGEMDPFGYYFLRKVGVPLTRMEAVDGGASGVNLKGNLGVRLNRLSVDKDFEQLKPLNAAMGNLTSLISNFENTAGVMNNAARGWTKMTGNNFFAAGDDNQQRIIDEAALAGNYQAIMARSSGGTFKEREKIREAINFGGLNEEQSVAKATGIYDNLMKRQENIFQVLENKGYKMGEILAALGEDETSNFYNNIQAYDYLMKSQINDDFDSEEFRQKSGYNRYVNQFLEGE